VTIATNGVLLSVGLSAGQSVCLQTISSAKMAEPIDMLSGI